MTAQQNLRVVSLLPSATDVIAVAGGTHLLVGRSHECDWPSDVRKLPILTGAVNQFTSSKQMDDVVKASLKRGEGLYYLDQELLKELKPDVILTQDLCNVCSVDLHLVQQTIDLLSIKPKVVTLNPQKLSDILEDISRVGKAVGREQESKTAVSALQQRVHRAQAAAQAAQAGQDPIKVLRSPTANNTPSFPEHTQSLICACCVLFRSTKSDLCTALHRLSITCMSALAQWLEFFRSAADLLLLVTEDCG